jgi:hypothetical protein
MTKKQGVAWRKKYEQEVLKRYRSGESMKAIGNSYGVTAKPVARVLRDFGITVRGKAFYSKGERNSSWKGGRRIDKHGYILIYQPEHPYRGRHNCVREHRLVMEAHLGRYLSPVEVVDHINGITNDNRLENLRLFANNAEHLRATRTGKRPRWSESGLERLRTLIRNRRIPAKRNLPDGFQFPAAA